MDNHVKFVGILHIFFGGMKLFGAIAVVGVAIISGFAVPLDDLPVVLMSLLAVATFVTLLAVPGIIAGIGLLNGKAWARYLAIVLAIFDLFEFPVGTLVGVYVLWVLLQTEPTQQLVPQPGV